MNPINNLKNLYWHQKHFGLCRLVYSAGMPRSGSTLLFNMLKLILETEYKNRLGYGWVEEVDQIQKSDVYLVKTHHLNRLSVFRSFRTFYTYRDVRDVLVSRLRKFDNEPNMDIVRYYIRQYDVAKNSGVEMLRYESFIANQIGLARQLSSSLSIEADPNEILSHLPVLGKIKGEEEVGHDEHTLLHKNHKTGTMRREWEEILPSDIKRQIHEEFEWWLLENNYEL